MKNRELLFRAIKTAVIFFVFGFVWVLVSDEVVHQVSPNYHIEQQLQRYKSWFFILLTAVLIFFIFWNQLKKVIDYKDKLLVSERSLSVVLENIGEGIISTNKTGTITSMNKVAENIIGLRAKEATGKSLFEVLRFYDYKGFDITGMLFNKPNSLMDIDEAVNLKLNDGSKNVQVFINSDRIYDTDGQHMGNILAFKDISERKRAEEEIKTFKYALGSSSDAIGIATPEGKHYYQNRTFDQMFGDIGNQHPAASIYADEEMGREVFESIMAGKDWSGEVSMYGKDNEELDVLLRAYAVKKDGEITALVGVHTDISDRKQAMDALEKSEDRLSKILIAAIDGMWDWNLLTNSVYFDPRYYQMAGYEPNEFAHTLMEFQKRVHPDDVDRVMEHAQQHLEGNIDRFVEEFRFKKKNGDWLWIQGRGEIVEWDETGTPTRFIGTHTAITDRKLAEFALRESEQKLRDLLNNLDAGVVVHAADTSIILNNPRASELLGLNEMQMKGKQALDPEWKFLDDNSKALAQDEYPVNRVVSSKKPIKNMLVGVVRAKDKDIVWVLVNGFPVLGSQGEIIEVIISFIDITERRKSEQAIKESRERFDLAVNATKDGIYDWNLISNEIYFSPAWKIMLGYRDDELPNDLSVWEKLTTPEDIKKSWVMQDELINKKRDRFEMEFKMKHKNGHLIDVLSRSEAYFDENGKATRIVGTHVNITDRKLAEKAVRESEERYKKIVETTHDLIWSCDVEGNIWYINEASKKIYGYAPEDMIGQNFEKFLTKTQLKEHRERFTYMVKEKIGTIEFDTEITNKKGEIIYLKDNVTILNDNNGELRGVLGASKNVTEKVLAEQALQDSMARLELALDGGGLGLWDYDAQSLELIVSEQWSQMLGFDDIKIISVESFERLVHPDDLEDVNNAFLEYFNNQQKELNVEFRMKHSDGNWKWILSQGKIMERDEHGKTKRIVGTNLDVTETKHLELELQRQVKIYSSFIKYSSEGIYLFELDEPMSLELSKEEQIQYFYRYGKVATCNDAFAKMYGYSKAEDLVGKKQSQLHGGDDVPENLEIMKKFINSDYRIMQALSKEVGKDGNEIYISNNVVGIIEEGKLVRTWGSQYDITDRIVAQIELQESEKKYRLLFQTNPVPLVILSVDNFNFLDVNLALEHKLGYSREEFSKMKAWDIRPELSMFTKAEMKAQLEKNMGVSQETKLVSKNGEIVLVEVIYDMITFEGKQAVLAAFNDITAIKEAEKRVLKSIIEGEDNERKRVSIEIHDGLGQNLTAASLNFDSLKQSIQSLKEKDVAKFCRGLEFLKSAIEESRNIAHNLMPKAIDDFGLIPSLTSLFNQIEKSTGINVKFYENLGDGRLNRQIELNLYRITQEAINNLIKHSHATEVDIQLVLHKQEIIYTFEDNGIGFDKSSIEIAGKGMGLKSIFNRVVTMSGTFNLDTLPQRGASITIEIPI